jgi:uncharacterized protein YdeI (YjbR/CyaY-like superfamily)
MTTERPQSQPLPLLEVANAAELRAWLEENATTSRGVRLAVSRKGGSATKLTYEDAIEEALAFGWIDSKSTALDEERFSIQFTPRKPGGTWARSNKERIERLTAQGRMTPLGLAAVEVAKADESWGALDDVEDLRVPDDLERALALGGDDVQAKWEAQSASQRRLALFWLSTAKRPETRERRVIEIVRAARERRRLW